MTAETDRTTYYFWAIAQSRASQDGNFENSIFDDIQRTVREDVEVFEAQQRSLQLKPYAAMVTIGSDAAPIAARRIIARLVRAEESGNLQNRDQN